MYLNQFSVRIVGGKEQSGGYVEMEHGQHYSLTLRNDRSERCDARVEIDGKEVGAWRVGSNQSLTIERPTYDQARFTFYRLGSKEGEQAQLDRGNPNLGLVKVTFTPERKIEIRPLATSVPVTATPDWHYIPGWKGVGEVTASTSNDARQYDHNATISYYNANSFTAGGTGLSGHSSQQFYTVGPMEYDLTQQTVIHLRLVGRKEEGQAVRPLTTYSTPVPPAVD